MMTLPHQDCKECRLNVEIISVNGDLISKQILQGMEKSGEQIAVHVNRKGELLSVMTIRTTDVPESLSLDHELEIRCTEYLKDLKTGEALIMMTTVQPYWDLQTPSSTAALEFVLSGCPLTPSRKSYPTKHFQKRNQESSPDKPGSKETCQWHSFNKNPRAVTS